MPIVDYTGTCPECGCTWAEGEQRPDGIIREECPACGYFYEEGSLRAVVFCTSGVSRRELEDIPVKVIKPLKDGGWLFIEDIAYRLSRVEKGGALQGRFRFIGHWYMLPAVYMLPTSLLRSIELSAEEIAAFNPQDWRLKDRRG